MRIGFGRAGAVSLLAFGVPAVAADLTVSASQSTPVATATASGNAPGNITVTSAGSIIVTSGTAATINSANSLTNGGTIGSSAASGAIAVLFNGSGGSLINNGTINVTGTGGSGNTGLLINGGPLTGTITSGLTGSIAISGDGALGVSLATPFTGNIDLRAVTVTGANATAISLTGPLTGNLSLEGSIFSTGAGGYGLLVAAPVSGTIDNGGAIQAGSARTTDTTNNFVSGNQGLAGARIGASVAGGLINDRYYIDTTGKIVAPALVDTAVNTLVTGSIIATGTAPALWIAPAAASTQAISLGAAGIGGDAFAVVNRGSIQASIASAATATTAIRIGGGSAATLLAGGIVNQSTGTISASSIDASTTGVSLLAGASVPEFRNIGVLATATGQTAASGSTAAGAGGAAFGVVVEAGASLPLITNTGTIAVTATGTNAGTAILDRSGTVTSIVNTGTIRAAALNGQATRAIDLSTGSAGTTIANSGTITGDIRFGGGYSTLQASGGTIGGAITYGTGGGLIAVSGTGVISGNFSSPAPLDATLAGTGRLSLVGGPATLKSVTATGNSVLVVPVSPGGPSLTVTGAASFTGASSVSLSLQSLALNQALTIIQANGGFSTDHLATLIDATSAPYLFTASTPTLTGTTLGITLTRKSAADIGLTGGQAALYTASLNAFTTSPAAAAAIANLSNAAAVAAAYRQIRPPSASSAPLQTAVSLADTGFGAASQRLEIIASIRRNGGTGTGVWGQQVGDFTTQKPGTETLGYSSAAFGIAGGADTPLLGLDAVGISLLSYWNTVRQTNAPGLTNVPLNISTQGIEPYFAKSWKHFFVEGTVLAAKVSYDSSRAIAIGGFADTINAHWTGTQFGAGLTIGARAQAGRLRFVPSNSLFWTTLKQNAFTETGGGAFRAEGQQQVGQRADRHRKAVGRLSVSCRRERRAAGRIACSLCPSVQGQSQPVGRSVRIGQRRDHASRRCRECRQSVVRRQPWLSPGFAAGDLRL